MPQIPNNLKPPNIMNEVKKFISGTARSSHSVNMLDLTRTATSLLNNVPASRDATLEYFCTVFFKAVNKHFRQLETNTFFSIVEENIMSEIYYVLNDFVNENPKAWAPIILNWSLDLLGTISSDYSKRSNISENQGIIDTLQQWMSCQATRTLVEMTTQCLKYTMLTDSEACINILWNINILHHPNFDWVVAHVGNCFPKIVIKKILSCGLKDFASFDCNDHKKQKSDSKLSSVVSILSYLANGHFHEIRVALLNLFSESLEEKNANDDWKKQKYATVPFLLKLASLSPILSKVLINDISQILKPDIIPKLVVVSSEWVKFFNNNPTNLINTTVSIALGCNQGALQIINILLDTSLNTENIIFKRKNDTQNVKNISQEILELILQETDYLSRSDNTNSSDIPMLASIKQDLSMLTSMLLNDHPLKIKTASKLLSLLGTQNSNILIRAAIHVLQNADKNFHLAVLLRFIDDNINLFSKKCKIGSTANNNGLLTQVIEQAIREIHYSSSINDFVARRLFQNLKILLKWEKYPSVKSLSLKSNFISQAIKENLLQISILLLKTNNFHLASDIIEMLSFFNPVGQKNFTVSVELTLRITRAIIHYFFMCMKEENIIKKERGLKFTYRFLQDLTTQSSYTRMLALREILESTISDEHARHFGAKEKLNLLETNSLLLDQNHKQGTGSILAQRHSSVFHAGVIGQGLRKFPSFSLTDKEIISLNKTLLINVLKVCCSNHDMTYNPVDTDALTMVSLIMVELISPDVMYNGLPWPDEDFAKVTVERDLQIRRAFKDYPVLWSLLQMTAWYRPALAYCSVLARAIVATVMNNWNLQEGQMITQVMALGQLLPPPLHSISDDLSQLDSQQIMLVMRYCVWMYMHENVPSPMLFTRTEPANIAWRDTDSATPDIRFTDTLRLAMLTNIQNLGSLYSSLFYDDQK